jgi:enamine deaminase RidA (YjgF/YER057c/UK114 family)
MTDILRTPGQSPIFPGAVAHDGLILTSGVIHPALFEPTNPVPGFREQASVALEEVLRFVSDAGGSPDTVLKVDAYLSKPEHVTVWNEVFTAVWPVPGPARLTLVTAFVLPGLEIEIQAVAARN